MVPGKQWRKTMKFPVREQLLPHLIGDLDVEIEPGKIRVYTGENGIGKSTLLKHLSCAIPESVFCEQKNMEHFFDRPVSTFRNILLKSQYLDRGMFERFWNESGLSSREDRQVVALSGGESQLLKLIVHAAVKSETFLFDEPGQNLDRGKKQLASDLMSKLKESGKAVLIVEHDFQWLPSGTMVTKLANEDGILIGKETWTI